VDTSVKNGPEGTTAGVFPGLEATAWERACGLGALGEEELRRLRSRIFQRAGPERGHGHGCGTAEKLMLRSWHNTLVRRCAQWFTQRNNGKDKGPR